MHKLKKCVARPEGNGVLSQPPAQVGTHHGPGTGNSWSQQGHVEKTGPRDSEVPIKSTTQPA